MVYSRGINMVLSQKKGYTDPFFSKFEHSVVA